MAQVSGDEEEEISSINIVPLVDIILVVLIIFMVTAPTVIKSSLSLKLPEAASGESTENTTLNVSLSTDGRMMLNGQEINEDELRQRTTDEVAKNPEIQALIAADQEIPYGEVVRVMDWVKASGVKNLAVTTDKLAQE